MKKKQNNKKQLVLLFFIFLLIWFVRLLQIQDYINFETFKESREYLFNIVHTHYWPSVFLFIISYILICTLSIPVAAIMTLISGFLFDILPGTIYVNIAATIGATFTFLIFRYLLGNKLQAKYKDKLLKLNKNIGSYGSSYLLIIRLIAIIPFFLANILIALTNVPLKTFVWTTSLGIIPASLIYTYAGKHIVNINSVYEIFSPKMVFVFIVLILFVIVSVLIKNSRKGLNVPPTL